MRAQKPKTQSKPERSDASPEKALGEGVGTSMGNFAERLQLARMLSEKCELAEAKKIYSEALKQARALRNVAVQVEAIGGLIRLAAEALQEAEISSLSQELDGLIQAHSRNVPPMIWYAKGIAVARFKDDFKLARRHFLRFLRASKALDPADSTAPDNRDECVFRAWGALATNARDLGKLARAETIALSLSRDPRLNRFSAVGFQVFHLLGRIAERRRDFEGALKYYREAQSTALGARNWYLYCYVLLSYAAIARQQQSYASAYQYLEMADRVATGPEFGSLRRGIETERTRLEQDAVDILIDSRKGIVETREAGAVSLRKQYVLLNILEALSTAHEEGAEGRRGLSKAEIISKVWREEYRPEAHDNKLYYNINRLRKLIEPDTKKPQYLLNWREGYRLAPGLKVRRLGSSEGARKERGGNENE